MTEVEQQRATPHGPVMGPPSVETRVRVAMLTGGQDPHYSYGLTMALVARGTGVELIGSDELDNEAYRATPLVTFLNLRGSQDRRASTLKKAHRVAAYYLRLLRYAATARPTVFHILWNNKIQLFDRTLLMLYYRLLGKRVVLTAHNVNAGRRDAADSAINRWTLKAQYRLCDGIFVHTAKMKRELVEEFAVREDRVTVVPYGINNAVPSTALTPCQAKAHFGIQPDEKTILFFGQIGHYKGLDYLVDAFERLTERHGRRYRLIVAGKPKPGADEYWQQVSRRIQPHVAEGTVRLETRFIPDDVAEYYFKAADVLVLPYREIFQSGILFFGYGFGLPVVVTDVGSLREDVVEGWSGLVCRPDDPGDLARTLERYFESDMYTGLETRRREIRAWAQSRHSWDTVAALTEGVYANVLGARS